MASTFFVTKVIYCTSSFVKRSFKTFDSRLTRLWSILGSSETKGNKSSDQVSLGSLLRMDSFPTFLEEICAAVASNKSLPVPVTRAASSAPRLARRTYPSKAAELSAFKVIE